MRLNTKLAVGVEEPPKQNQYGSVLMVAFNKAIATELAGKLDDIRVGNWTPVTGSVEQEEIWDAILNRDEHLIITAGPGTGKSRTLLEVVRLMGAGVNVQALTYHSAGLRMLGKVRVDNYAVHHLVRSLWSEYQRRGRGGEDKWEEVDLITKLVGIVKNYLLDTEDDDSLVRLADHHLLDLTPRWQTVLQRTWEVIQHQRNIVGPEINFDDMIWRPVIGVGVERRATYDTVMVDEFQDTNLCQQELAMKLIGDGGRMIVVGDPRQAIYGFRGADVHAFPRIKERLEGTGRGVIECILTLTRRCPKKVVDLARRISPTLTAMDNATDGVVGRVTEKGMFDAVGDGDMVLCRVNADLIRVAYKLIAKGVKAQIRGRDIGRHLGKLAIEIGGETAEEFVRNLDEWRDREVGKFLPQGQRAEAKIARVMDIHECLCAVTEEMKGEDDRGGRGYAAVVADFLIDLFSDESKEGVLLTTVHRGKGLEADRVYILRPDILPMKTKREWEMEQEMNIIWVAVTRAKRELRFVGEIPEVLLGGEGGDV